jgi:hypothetical protein
MKNLFYILFFQTLLINCLNSDNWDSYGDLNSKKGESLFSIFFINNYTTQSNSNIRFPDQCDRSLCLGAIGVYDKTDISLGTIGNGNGYINNNEKVRIDISLATFELDARLATIRGVRGRLSSTSNKVSISSEPKNIKNQPLSSSNNFISTGISGTVYFAFGTNASVDNSPVKALIPHASNSFMIELVGVFSDYEEIPLKLEIFDNADNIWRFNIKLKVFPSEFISIYTHSLISYFPIGFFSKNGNPYGTFTGSVSLFDRNFGSPLNTSGNNNDRINGEESIRMNLQLINISNNNTILSNSVLSCSNIIEINQPQSINYGEFTPNQNKWLNNSNDAGVANSFRLVTKSDIIKNDLISCSLQITSNKGNSIAHFDLLVDR